MLYKDWLNIWLQNYAKPAVKSQTYRRYCEICRLHIAPYLGDEEVHSLSAVQLQSLVTRLLTCGNVKTGGGLSPSFVHMVVSVVQNSLKQAYMCGIAPAYVAGNIRRPRLAESPVQCFSPAEQRQLENYILSSGKDKLFGIVLCLYTGLRIGELLSLTWQDVDLQHGTLLVCKTCFDSNCNGHCRVEDEPKTPRSRRTIPLPKPILDYLRLLKKRSESLYVVAEKGKPVFVRSYQRTFELLLKKLNLPHRGFHALRHTFATRAIECGMDVRTLSELLGHTNSAITLNRYVHSLPEHKRALMNKLGQLLQ